MLYDAHKFALIATTVQTTSIQILDTVYIITDNSRFPFQCSNMQSFRCKHEFMYGKTFKINYTC